MAKEDKKKDPEDDDEDDDGDDGDDKTDWKAEAEKWKRQSRSNETKAKANADAAKKLTELESANKSELEKAQDAAKTAEGKAASAEKELLRLRVAVRKGLSESQAKRLVGDTEEELESDADELLEAFGSSKKEGNEGETEEKPESKSNGNRPKEQLKSGAAPKETPAETDPIKLAEGISRPGGIL